MFSRTIDCLEVCLGCLPLTWANRSVYGLSKWYAKFRTGKFSSGIAFTICTDQFHLTENGREGLKLVSKMALRKWNTNFRLEYFVRKTGLPFQMFRCSQKFSVGKTQKVVFHLLSNRISRKILVNGKQPYSCERNTYLSTPLGSNFLTRNDVTKDVDFRNSKEHLNSFRVISLSWRVPSSLSSCLVCSAM